MAHLLFLSHAGADTDRALKLAAAIEASPDAQTHGLKVWLDKRPDGPHRLHAGTPWQDQLERAIAKESTAFGLLLTREGARNWVRLEVRVALDRVIAEQRAGAVYPFVPIIADDPGDLAHLPPFAQQYQGVRLTEDGHGVADLVRVAARLDAAQPVRLVEQPFMGLEAFEAKDAALFFGRRKETQDLVDRLRTTNMVLVTGDSGSGKSSLVKAGLIPAFREGALADPLCRRPEPGQWHVVEMRPGTDPFEGMVEGAQRAATTAGIAPEMIFALGGAIRTRDPGGVRDALRQSGPPGASLLLVVDQFEELWTLTIDDTKRRDFLATLLALVPDGDLTRRTVGTMRRDYYHLHTDDERLRDRLAAKGNAGRFLLGAMAPESLRDIVEKPLLLAGENEIRAAALADEVVKDVAGEPGNLALVEMALHESWERRAESGGDLALAYQRLDRLEGALARAAEEVFWNPSNDRRKLTEAERPIAEALFMRLVRAGDAGGATRRPVAFAELEEPARAVARKLATPECRRLLVLREPDGDGHGEEAITVELAHEQLVTQWPDYRFWLRGTVVTRHRPDPARAADKRALDRLMDRAANWSGRGRRSDDLARGGDLAEFKALRASSARERWLSLKEREFVDRSTAASLEAERARKRWTMVGAIASLLLLCLAGLFFWQWREAEAAKVEARGQALAAEANKRLADTQLQEAKRIDSRRLANLSLRLTDRGDAVTGILLALQALPKNLDQPDRPIVPEVWTALRYALSEQRELLNLIHDRPVQSVSLSPDLTRILTGSWDGTARIWTVDGRGEPVILRGHEGNVNSAVFSPDGTRVLTASDDLTARVWNSDGKGEPVILRGHNGSINSAVFSPDGSRVLTASDDSTARVWNSDGKGEPVILRGHDGNVNSAVFSPDGTRVLTASSDRTARVWGVDGADQSILLRAHLGSVVSAAFSTDGTRIITASTDTTARVWNADGSGEPVVLRGHEGELSSAVFSTDGRRALTASSDRTARVWDISGTNESIVLRGHEEAVVSAMFSLDGTRVVTASWDKTARIWSINGDDQPIILGGHHNWLNNAVFSDDDSIVLTTSMDNSARLWRVSAVHKPAVLRGHESWVRTVAFSPNGSEVVTASDDTTLRIWSTANGNGLATLTGHNGPVNTAVFSPDGSSILSASSDGTARIWQHRASVHPVVLRGHEGPVWSAEFSSDGSHVVTASWDKTARVWPVKAHGEPIILRGHQGSINSATFSRDGLRILTSSDDKTARIWSIDAENEPITLNHDNVVKNAEFSPDGNQIITSSADGFVTIWNSIDGSRYRVISPGGFGEAIASKFSPEGLRVLIAWTNQPVIMTWQWEDKSTPILLFGHSKWVISAAFSPGGAQIATGSADATARVWTFGGSGEPITFRGHEGWVVSVDFNPDGTMVATASQDKTARLWPLNTPPELPEQLAAQFKSLKLPRQLTTDQVREYYILDDM